MIPAILLAALVLAAAAYAQHQIPRFTKSARTANLVRAGLIALGLVCGYVAADNLSEAGVPAPLTFLIGFGAVHVRGGADPSPQTGGGSGQVLVS